MEFLNFTETSNTRPYVMIQPRPYVHKLEESRASSKGGKVQKATSPRGGVSGGRVKRLESFERMAWKVELRNRLIARMARLHKLPKGYLETQGLQVTPEGLQGTGGYWKDSLKGHAVKGHSVGMYSGEEKSASGKMFTAVSVNEEPPLMPLSTLASGFVTGEDFEMYLEGGRVSPLVPPPPLPLCEGDEVVESFLNYCEGSILSPTDFFPFS